MNYDKIFENFLEKVKERGCYASYDEVAEVTREMLNIIKSNKDATPEELVEKVIENDIVEMENLKNKYLMPGYTIGLNVGNINVKYFGGDMDNSRRSMKSDAMFDIASMSKMYTQVVLYNLIKEGYLSLDDKIEDLDPRFVNIGDVSIRELSEFTVEFQTPGNITLMENEGDAKDTLYNISVAKYPDGNIKRGKYFYTDFGMMITKEVMEAVTGIKYEDLVDKYIINKLGLKNTKLIVPVDQIELLTGSPNTKYASVNDPKAISVGGFSGHAGVFASSDDLIKFGKAIEDGTLLAHSDLEKAYTHGIKDNRGIIGNTYVATEKGLGNSYIETISPMTDFSIQGSTRTHLNVGNSSVSTILLNPASISLEKAMEYEAQINEKNALEGKPAVSIVRHFAFNKDGNIKEYNLIDATKTLNYRQVDPITTMNAKTSLRLEFLNEVINEYDKNYTKEVNISKKI